VGNGSLLVAVLAVGHGSWGGSTSPSGVTPVEGIHRGRERGVDAAHGHHDAPVEGGVAGQRLRCRMLVVLLVEVGDREERARQWHHGGTLAHLPPSP
jgi:hypothetical protein